MTSLPWPKMPARFVSRMLSGHTALGLALSALLYIVCLSGTLVVFHNEFSRWEQPTALETGAVTPGLVQTTLTNALARAEDMPDRITLVLPTDDGPRLMAGFGETYWLADETGALGDPVAHPFSEFLVDLHFYLHLPSTLGLTLVGLLGVMMLGLVLSGFLAHPRIFRDAFLYRRGKSERLSETDLHNRLSVWAAPFHITIALTGAVLGLASIAAYALALAFHDGDLNAVFPPIFGDAFETGPAPDGLADAAAAYRTLQAERPDLEPWLIYVNGPGTEAQNIEILTKVPGQLAYYDEVQFDAAGNMLGSNGMSDGETGQMMAAAVYSLHFGWYGGLWSKFAYLALGLALTVVCASGFTLWLIKRREKGKPCPRLERAWVAVVWGSPATLAASMAGSFTGLLSEAVLVPFFWIALALVVALASAAGSKRAWSRSLRIAAGLFVLAGLAAHHIAYWGTFRGEASWGVSAGLAVAALLILASALPGLRPVRAPRPRADEAIS
ncbi:PepSY-associated TM helix domain-containing protein [Maricaulis sp.]|uniref:PepSY-associated TM helix domain-containing protein n=1 Tax=Maricaulis sp. TaxID=1486257 RepID=UPI0026202600|nr:PepSY-associated TM helix domain-containing protein [Maricaulis sp.]